MIRFIFRLTLQNGDSEDVDVSVACDPDESDIVVQLRAWQAAAIMYGYAEAMEIVR